MPICPKVSKSNEVLFPSDSESREVTRRTPDELEADRLGFTDHRAHSLWRISFKWIDRDEKGFSWGLITGSYYMPLSSTSISYVNNALLALVNLIQRSNTTACKSQTIRKFCFQSRDISNVCPNRVTRWFSGLFVQERRKQWRPTVTDIKSYYGLPIPIIL